MFLAADNDVPDILIVDDTPADCHFVAAILTAQGYRVRSAQDGRQAIEEIDAAAPDLILLDINMPDMDGFDVCRQIKQSLQHAAIPVIFISAFDDTDIKVAAFNCGGIDYITKPFRVAEIKARIHAHLQLKRAHDRLGYQAGHDPLTGLPNRSLLADRLHQAIGFAERYGGQVAVAYIDLDKFKAVNDRYGHKAGDLLLVETAYRLQACVRDSDTVARIGGDEFVIVFYDRTSENAAAHAMQRILESISAPVLFDGCEIVPSCSIGFACYPQDGRDVDALLRNADAAMYRAKELGRNNFQFYTGDLNARVNARISMEKSLRGALERDEFELHYQPRIELRSGRVAGLEALIRWRHPELGLLPPLQFVPLAEETGLIEQIGEWVVRAACRQHLEWQRLKLAPIPVAVNVSAAQFFKPGFAQAVAAILAQEGVPPQQIELDLKESVLMRDPAASQRVLTELRQAGIGLSIDDFGTGFSNLGFLKRFPIDRIKLDPSFVSEVERQPEDLAVTDAVIAMAHSLGLKVAVEGVERGSQLMLLAARGCDEMQGDYFSPALPVGLCTALLRERRVLPAEKIGPHRAGRTLLLIQGVPEGAALLAAARRVTSHVLQAQDARAAFDLLAAHDVGVVLCEQKLEELSGVDFLARVSNMYPDAVRVLCDDGNDAATAADAINRGRVHKLVRAPCAQDELAGMLEAAFALRESAGRPRRAG
ncbi:MAG TPA: EAL domain-containing protein [Noviherbaspirillum sp.]|uniref:EAL domain-containing protein n=1 Tax=Noviherbaspirillum sp. TaxID=1926288 RepID=UPI002D6176EC|nr:EAL domain-containing protein [Noviherbaspirillum sp.]HYD97158.1 EAL domain-containing protein [Noviherbaspirillum sp.]